NIWISHCIKRYVHLGFDVTTSEDIEKAIRNLSRTSTTHIQPNRKNRKKSNIKTILEISNYSEWTWPVERPHAGFICSRPLPGFGKPNYISSTQIYKLLKSDIEQSQPEYSDHTVPQETWMMPICHLSTSNSDLWDLRRWTTAKLHEELENLNIPVDKSMLRSELVKILKTNLCLETLDNLENNISNIENTTESTDLMDVDKSPDIILFSLPLGWTLKHNQKYGKKGGKRLSKNVVEALKRFFMLGQANSSDRYTASNMYNSLLELVESGEINEEDIPTQSTIEN
ncbi:30902_t:CDS:2, partial [Racocetra persica]